MKTLFTLILFSFISCRASAQYTLEQITDFLNHQPAKILYWYNYQGDRYLSLKHRITYHNDLTATNYQIVTSQLRSFQDGAEGATVFYYLPRYDFKALSIEYPDNRLVDYLETRSGVVNSDAVANAVEDSIKIFENELSKAIEFRRQNKEFLENSLPTYSIIGVGAVAGGYYSFRRSGKDLRGIGNFSLGVLATSLFIKSVYDLIDDLVKMNRRKRFIQRFDSKIQGY